MDIKAGLSRIGEELVRCPEKGCEGIKNDPSSGIVPRGLFFEERDASQVGCAVIGINPGIADESEREIYIKEFRKNTLTYQTTVDYWERKLTENNRYYHRLHSFVAQIGITGSILWTELVKCENETKRKSPSLQTFRTCTRLYLKRELVIPNEWFLIAVGKKAYKVLAYLCPERTVVGVPHPTGAHGNFDELFEGNSAKNGALKPKCKYGIKRGQAVWLSDCLES